MKPFQNYVYCSISPFPIGRKRPRRRKTALVILYLGNRLSDDGPFNVSNKSFVIENFIFEKATATSEKVKFRLCLCWSRLSCVCSFSGNQINFRGPSFDSRKVTLWVPVHLMSRWKHQSETRGSSTVFPPSWPKGG